MAAEWEGNVLASDDGAGFRRATEVAVDKYREDPETPAEPVRLKVLNMYVEVQNPIHQYIVVLGSDR
jgi:hypothetical protein